LIDSIKSDYTKANLLLLKRIWIEPRNKESKKLDKDDPRNKPEVIPVSLEDIMNMRRQAIEE
jgi:hypothetical protein